MGLMCGIGRCALCVCVALVQWTCVDWRVGGLISFMRLALEVPGELMSSHVTYCKPF